MSRKVKVFSILLLGTALAGCASPPPSALTAAEMPQAYSAPRPVGEPLKLAPAWWQTYSSPELSDFIGAAKKNNLDVAVAMARIEQAQAESGIAASALFPKIDLGASAKREGSKTPGTTFNTFGLSLGASYELDFWGLAQSNLRAARNSARAAIYAGDVVSLTTEASVASTYFAVLALRERISIAKRNVDAARRILAVTRAKVTNGMASSLELAQQEALLAGQEATVPALEEQEREMRYALALLLGRTPEGFDVKGGSLAGLSAPVIEPGLPSSLLERRPDIAQAEATLLSAHANLDAARAAFLPAIGLTANGGYMSTAVKDLINPSNIAWDVGASLLQTIFDGGELSSRRDLALAQEKEMIADYRKTVLSALSDVETAIGSSASLADQERYTLDQVSSTTRAFKIAELQYREGVVDLLTLLQTQQALFTAEDQLVQIRLARLQSSVGLYRALGGGWEKADETETPTRNAFNPLPY
jgi:NodT family efflux transporter outer membrane factor (OMF) lipoprotein